jgi:hypothetical protein
MISELERYKRVCSQLDTLCKRMDDTFRLFVQLSVAVVGGFIWLKMQPNASTVAHLALIARWIIPILAIFTIGQIIADWRAWFGYREAEAALLKRPDLRPTCLGSAKLEMFRVILATLVGIGAFVWMD